MKLLPENGERKAKRLEAITDFDTRGLEVLLGVLALVNAAQAAYGSESLALAPFLSTDVYFLQWRQPFWVAGLTGIGLFNLVMVGLGFMRDNHYRERSLGALIGSLLWSAVLVCILTGDMEKIHALRFAVWALFSYAVAIVLILKSDLHREQKRLGNAEKQASRRGA